MLLNHIAIISSSIESIKFYEKLGFQVVSDEDRGYDKLIYMNDGLTALEIYVDSTHPKRLSSPEALGLRHLCFESEHIEMFNAEIKEDKNGRFCFIYDPDGLPIEIRERVLNTPKE